ncbi:MAG: hypothetical protein ACRD4F_14445 [Candidatus Angelobacter sp.]
MDWFIFIATECSAAKNPKSTVSSVAGVGFYWPNISSDVFPFGAAKNFNNKIFLTYEPGIPLAD